MRRADPQWPLLNYCEHCHKNKAGIASLTEHLLTECLAKEQFERCPSCKKAVQKTLFNEHIWFCQRAVDHKSSHFNKNSNKKSEADELDGKSKISIYCEARMDKEREEPISRQPSAKSLRSRSTIDSSYLEIDRALTPLERRFADLRRVPSKEIANKDTIHVTERDYEEMRAEISEEKTESDEEEVLEEHIEGDSDDGDMPKRVVVNNMVTIDMSREDPKKTVNLTTPRKEADSEFLRQGLSLSNQHEDNCTPSPEEEETNPFPDFFEYLAIDGRSTSSVFVEPLKLTDKSPCFKLSTEATSDVRRCKAEQTINILENDTNLAHIAARIPKNKQRYFELLFKDHIVRRLVHVNDAQDISWYYFNILVTWRQRNSLEDPCKLLKELVRCLTELDMEEFANILKSHVCGCQWCSMGC